MHDSKCKNTLNRTLNQSETLAMAFGAMVGWGWVALAGGWVSSAGVGGAVSAFVLGGIIMILIGLTYAELASAMPFAGGEHVYSHRALGACGAFVCTWAIALAYISVSAFEAVALPTVLEELLPNIKAIKLWTIAGYDVYLTWALIGISGSVVVTWINVIGVKTAAKLQMMVTIVLLLAGVLFLSGASLNGSTDNLKPLFNDGINGFILVLGVVPFMFIGFDVIPQMAEEINLPHKKIGHLIIVAVLLAITWYGLICIGVGLSIPFEKINDIRLAPSAGAASVWGSAIAGKLIIIAGIAGIITSWNAFFVGGSRAIYVMAKADQLPRWLGNLHPKYNTPANAIILMGVFCSTAPLFGRNMLVWLVDAGSYSVVIAYGLVALSFLVLRAREPEMVRPYRVKAGYTVGVIALLSAIALSLLYLPGGIAALVWPYEWIIVFSWIALGFIFYFSKSIQFQKSPPITNKRPY